MIHDIASGRMYATAEFVSLIKKIENGELVPVLHGEWKRSAGLMPPICSNCYCPPFTPGYVGDDDFYKRHFKMCPNCGARMDGGDHGKE